MHPDQMYMLAKLRMAETQAQARDAQRISGRRPEPLWQVLVTRMRRSAASDRRQHQPLASAQRPRAAEIR